MYLSIHPSIYLGLYLYLYLDLSLYVLVVAEHGIARGGLAFIRHSFSSRTVYKNQYYYS